MENLSSLEGFPGKKKQQNTLKNHQFSIKIHLVFKFVEFELQTVHSFAILLYI